VTWNAPTNVALFPRSLVRRLSFWTAVALPGLYVPLVATGIGSRAELLAVGALLALNVLTLLAGHCHRHAEE